MSWVEIACPTCGKTATRRKGNVKKALAKNGRVFCSHACVPPAHGHARRGKKTKAYLCWENMHGRCGNPNDTSYTNYGGRGIKVCDRWKSFENFLADMGDPPEGMTLDRINNDKGYSKENCRWTTPSVQGFNKRLRSTNKTGIVGITFDRHQEVFKALAIINGKRLRLYRGTDFFEACCCRRSWESEVNPKQHKGAV